VLDLLAEGGSGNDVARLMGVSASYVYQLRRSLGGVYRPVGTTYCARYLDREERHELIRLREGGHSIRAIARLMGRSPSTISRELRRNADPRTGRYSPERADRLAWERQRRPKPSKLSQNVPLRTAVQGLLDRRQSPEQVAGRLRLLHPDNPHMHVSHETIYQSLYVYPRGELTRELKAHLRTQRTTRKRRGRVERRGGIRDAVSIHDRPEEIETRLVPGHHEGDLIKGSMESNSAVGTIVERTTGYLTLIHLPEGYRAEQVATAITAQMSALPPWFVKSLTWDRGSELAEHKAIAENLNIDVYFADPYSPHQRGTNENTNGLIREYLPKGSDLSVHDKNALQWVADELNDRPRKRLGFHTPREALASLLIEELTRVASTT
jgi:IS30 family transposase